MTKRPWVSEDEVKLFIGLLLIAICITTLQSCGSAPKMDHPVTIYTGAPELNAICTIDSVEERIKTNLPVDAYIKRREFQCIKADSEEFYKFMAMSWDDAQMLFDYVETLTNKCKQWEP